LSQRPKANAAAKSPTFEAENFRNKEGREIIVKQEKRKIGATAKKKRKREQ
jgi:hypothetical protein